MLVVALGAVCVCVGGCYTHVFLLAGTCMKRLELNIRGLSASQSTFFSSVGVFCWKPTASAGQTGQKLLGSPCTGTRNHTQLFTWVLVTHTWVFILA